MESDNPTQDLREYFRKAYEFEAARRHNLAGYLPLRITLLALIMGALFAGIGNYKLLMNYWTWNETGCLILIVISFFSCFVFVIKFQFRHSYAYIAAPTGISRYHRDMAGFLENDAEGAREALEFIKNEHIECGSINCARNDLKSYYLGRLDLLIALSAFLTFAFVSMSVYKELRYSADALVVTGHDSE